MNLKFSIPALKKAFLAGAMLVTAGSTSACLNRPICGEDAAGKNSCEPRTTNVIVDQLIQRAVDKIDMLFVIDNSISMADKQEILALALPDLVNRFVSPICVDENGNQVAHPDSANEDCPGGAAREFEPIDDIHIGVVTSSLGGYGAPKDCIQTEGVENSEQAVDMARLLGSLPRGSAATGGQAFLNWTAGSNKTEFTGQFQALVGAAGEFGCGWEATLESWYRFLIEPYPYQKIVRVNCPFGGDTKQSCIGPETTAAGEALIDGTILSQRQQFLRPDSLVAIIMLSDENDCSFRANGQSWRLAQALTSDGFGINEAFKGTTACATDPNSECCHSCGATPPSGCATEADAAGNTVGAGCGESKKYEVTNGTEPNQFDQINLRCFQQKRRFGVDYLYPVERYSRALSAPLICPFEDDLDPDGCSDDQLVDNPLFDDLNYDPADPMSVRAPPRPASLVFLAGIVGVPWQDVAVDASGAELVYRSARINDANLEDNQKINWDWLIGPRNPADGIPKPADPLMIESVEPRSGTNPATGIAVADPSSGQLANPINGHEWNITDRSDLQYACIFPLLESEDCIDPLIDQEMRIAGQAVPNCDCTEFGLGPDDDPAGGFNNPLCQAGDGSYDRTQRYAKAYPSLRQLQVLHDFGSNSIVASICPKETQDMTAPDFGYRPAVAAIVERLKEQLADKCLPRQLGVREDGSVPCTIVEAAPPNVAGGENTCENLGARVSISPEVAEQVRASLESTGQCGDGTPCESFRLCEIKQLLEGEDPMGLTTCLNDPDRSTGNGWCYIDPAKGAGSDALVEKCPETEKRKLRFVGDGTPANGTVTFVACAGAVFDPGTADGTELTQ